MIHVLDVEPRFYSDEEIERYCNIYTPKSRIKKANLKNKLLKNNELLAEFITSVVRKEITRLKMAEGKSEQDCANLWHFKSRIDRG